MTIIKHTQKREMRMKPPSQAMRRQREARLVGSEPLLAFQ
jgi:hypothetical protein